MMRRVDRREGGKERFLILSPRLLKALRLCAGRRSTWLFPGRIPGRPNSRHAMGLACQIARLVSRNNGAVCRSRGAQERVDHMPDANVPSQFCRQSALRDGTPVVIRFVRPDDKGRLVTAFSRLEPETIYTRFFSFKKELSQVELDRLDAPDPEHRIGLVVTLGSGVEETIIAGASCVVLDTPGPIRSAEVAFTVEEDYQCQGLAGKLLATITDLARSRGIHQLEADVLPGNQAMLAVFRRSGLPMSTSRSEGVVHLVLDLAAGSPRDSGAGKR